MKKNIFLGLAILFTMFLVVEINLGQIINKPNKRQKPPKYKIVTSKHFDGALLLGIVIKPEFLNREDMKTLAKKIKDDFPNENEIEVAFFTTKQAAKHISLNVNAKDYEKNMQAWRASYRLNRATGEEYLSFAPIGRKYNDREEVNFNEKN